MKGILAYSIMFEVVFAMIALFAYFGNGDTYATGEVISTVVLGIALLRIMSACKPNAAFPQGAFCAASIGSAVVSLYFFTAGSYVVGVLLVDWALLLIIMTVAGTKHEFEAQEPYWALLLAATPAMNLVIGLPLWFSRFRSRPGTMAVS